MTRPIPALSAWRRPLAALLLITPIACTPRLEGGNQVNDVNVELTILKDARLADQTWDAVDNYMRDNAGIDPTGPGCAVGIARRGELVYLQGYGRAVVGGTICHGDDCVPVGGEAWGVGTMGAVGSVAKTFTATAAMLMHERGSLDVDATVGDYLPTINDALARTPIRALLGHASGVGGSTKGDAATPSWLGNAAACVGQDSAFCQTLSRTLARPAEAFGFYHAHTAVADLSEPPATVTPPWGVYSNVGYSVVGALVDQVARGTASGGYEAWIWNNLGAYRDEVDDPANHLSLALTHSWRADDIPHRAVGYRSAPGGDYDVLEAWQDGTLGVEGWEGPSGGWAMTIGDLTRFTVALNTAQLVTGPTLAEMRGFSANLDAPAAPYGLGMFLGDGQDMPYWHGGVIGGHSAVWTWWDNYNGTEGSLAVAIMCNGPVETPSEDEPFGLTAVARAIARFARPSQPRPRSTQALPSVAISSIDARQYALDRSGAWQAAPTGALVPLSLADTALLGVVPTRTGIGLELSTGVVRKGTVVAATAAQPLGPAVMHANPWFSTAPRRVTLPTTIGALTVDDVVVTGAFSDRGATLTGVTLAGVVDTRQAEALTGVARGSMCAPLRDSGACQPCRDGARACVSVRYEGIRGDRVGTP